MGSRQCEQHVPGVHFGPVNRRGFEGGKLEGFAGDQRELGAVLPALEQSFPLVDVSFGERHVLVGAPVTDGVDVVTDPDDRDRERLDLEAPRLPRCQLIESTEGDVVVAHRIVRVASVRTTLCVSGLSAVARATRVRSTAVRSVGARGDHDDLTVVCDLPAMQGLA